MKYSKSTFYGFPCISRVIVSLTLFCYFLLNTWHTVDVFSFFFSEVKTYNAGADSTLPSVPKKRKFESNSEDAQTASPAVKKVKQEEGTFLKG